MIGALAALSLIVAAASDEEEPDWKAQFRMLRGLGDVVGAYRLLFSQMTNEAIVAFFQELRASIRTSKDLDEALARMNEFVDAGWAAVELDEGAYDTGFEQLKVRINDDDGALVKPLFFRGKPDATLKGRQLGIDKNNALWGVTVDGRYGYTRIWGFEGDQRIVCAGARPPHSPGLPSLSGSERFVIVDRQAIVPVTVTPIAARIVSKTNAHIDVKVIVDGILENGETVIEDVFRLLIYPRDGSVRFDTARGVLGHRSPHKPAITLVDRINESTQVESMFFDDLLTEDVIETAKKMMELSHRIQRPDWRPLTRDDNGVLTIS